MSTIFGSHWFYSKSSLKENENVVPEQLHFVTVLSAICKSATTNHAMIGPIKNGLIGRHGDHAQNHVVVELESAEEHVRLLIISAVIIGLWFFINKSLICLFAKNKLKNHQQWSRLSSKHLQWRCLSIKYLCARNSNQSWSKLFPYWRLLEIQWTLSSYRR